MRCQRRAFHPGIDVADVIAGEVDAVVWFAELLVSALVVATAITRETRNPRAGIVRDRQSMPREHRPMLLRAGSDQPQGRTGTTTEEDVFHRGSCRRIAHTGQIPRTPHGTSLAPQVYRERSGCSTVRASLVHSRESPQETSPHKN